MHIKCDASRISRTHKLLALEDVAVVHVRRWVSGHKAEYFGPSRMHCAERNRGQSAGVQHELRKREGDSDDSYSPSYTCVSLSEFEYIVLSHTFVLCSRMSIALLVRNRCTLVFFIFSSISVFGS